MARPAPHRGPQGRRGDRRVLGDEVERTRPLRAAELRARRRRIRWLRHGSQLASATLVAWIGWRFVAWVEMLGGGAGVARPAGVEGFLPLSGLVSLRVLLATGTIHSAHPAALVVLLLVLATALLAKRAFCSWLCPVGTLVELLGAAGERLLGRRVTPPRWLDLPLRGIKYLLLGFFVWAIFVRMTPLVAAAFLESPYNRVADVLMLRFFVHPSALALGVLGVLALFALLVRDSWCRYLCPYGALLGLGSLLSPLRVTRHADACIDCGLCTRACPARLPVAQLGRVRSDECSACLSCVAACPVPAALRLETPAPWRRAVRPATFAALLLLIVGGGVLAAKATGHWQSALEAADVRRSLWLVDGVVSPPPPVAEELPAQRPPLPTAQPSADRTTQR